MLKKRSLLKKSNNPFNLFNKWFHEASKKEINDPNAMNLATVSDKFKPTSRMVLLKNYDEKGFVFYTNSKSKKGKAILHNPFVALNFHWKTMLRQVRIEGKISQVLDSEANDYFNSRHLESRLGAWASSQSKELKNRLDLERKIIFYKNKFSNKNITRPIHWTGFRVKPILIEFWQDMPYRLHDRLEYKKIGSKWVCKKLSP